MTHPIVSQALDTSRQAHLERMATIMNEILENPKEVIILTNRRPVRIDPAKWPIIASANIVNPMASSKLWSMYVRQHDDGRCIVYGDYFSTVSGETYKAVGEILETGGNVIDAIRRVTKSLGTFDDLADKCIARLPPEDLD